MNEVMAKMQRLIEKANEGDGKEIEMIECTSAFIAQHLNCSEAAALIWLETNPNAELSPEHEGWWRIWKPGARRV